MCVTVAVQVERPRNWQEAKDSGWQPPVYDNEEVKRQVQKGFLTKVYGILAIQLAVTTAFCVLFASVEAIQYAVVGNLWVTLALIFLLIPVLIGLVFLKNSYPWNMVLLAGELPPQFCLLRLRAGIVSH
jgi:hypothetical protein